jgi:predicted nucleic acid-binding protein
LIWAAAVAEAAHSHTTVSALIADALENLLAGCRVDPLDEAAAKAAGVLLGKCSMDPGAVDASVAEGALRRGDAVVTGNASHLRSLADGAGRKLEVIPVRSGCVNVAPPKS